MERAEHLKKAGKASTIVARLLVSSHGSNILLRGGVGRGRNRAHFRAVEQVERDDAAAAPSSDPREQELVGVEHGLAALPLVRRRGVHIEVPQPTHTQRLIWRAEMFTKIGELE